MRVVRVARPDGVSFGLLEDGEVHLVEPHPFAEHRPTGETMPLDDVRLLAPVIPTKVLAVGKNYAAHAAEMAGDLPGGAPGLAGGAGPDLPASPLIFTKLTTAVVGPGSPIVLPWQSEEVHHEAELAVVIGRMCRNVGADEAWEAVFGYTCANDVTARDLQRADGQWTRAKGFDTFCPLGPWIDTEVDPRDGLGVRCLVNGELRQEGSTSDMVFDVGVVIAYCSEFCTLLPGDVILTGTPAGVGPLRDGDRVEVEVDGVGVLANPVVAEA